MLLKMLPCHSFCWFFRIGGVVCCCFLWCSLVPWKMLHNVVIHWSWSICKVQGKKSVFPLLEWHTLFNSKIKWGEFESCCLLGWGKFSGSFCGFVKDVSYLLELYDDSLPQFLLTGLPTHFKASNCRSSTLLLILMVFGHFMYECDLSGALKVLDCSLYDFFFVVVIFLFFKLYLTNLAYAKGSHEEGQTPWLFLSGIFAALLDLRGLLWTVSSHRFANFFNLCCCFIVCVGPCSK